MAVRHILTSLALSCFVGGGAVQLHAGQALERLPVNFLNEFAGMVEHIGWWSVGVATDTDKTFDKNLAKEHFRKLPRYTINGVQIVTESEAELFYYFTLHATWAALHEQRDGRSYTQFTGTGCPYNNDEENMRAKAVDLVSSGKYSEQLLNNLKDMIQNACRAKYENWSVNGNYLHGDNSLSGEFRNRYEAKYREVMSDTQANENAISTYSTLASCHRPRHVYVITKKLESVPRFHHWAIKIVDDNDFFNLNSDRYIEAEKADPNGDVMDTEMMTQDWVPGSPEGPGITIEYEQQFNRSLYMGMTDKSNNELIAFHENWKREHPRYKFMETNCQVFAFDMVTYLGLDTYKIRHLECGTHGNKKAVAAYGFTANYDDPHAWAAHTSEYLGYEATAGEASVGFLKGIGGPELTVQLQVSTGFGRNPRTGENEGRILGFGYANGQVQTPFIAIPFTFSPSYWAPY